MAQPRFEDINDEKAYMASGVPPREKWPVKIRKTPERPNEEDLYYEGQRQQTANRDTSIAEYEQYKKDHPIARPAQPVPGLAEEPGMGMGDTLMQAGKQAALPTAGGMIGASLGSAVPVVGTYLGAAAGGMAGEGMNQLTGVTKPSLEQLIMAGAIPPALEGVYNVGRTALKLLPSQAGKTLSPIGKAHFDAKMAEYMPTIPASEYFAEAAAKGGMVKLDQTLKVAGEMLSRVPKTGRHLWDDFTKTVNSLQKVAAENGGALPAMVWEREKQGLGAILGKLGQGGKPGDTELRALYKAMYDDLANAGAKAAPGSTALLKANQATLREKTVSDILQYSDDAMKARAGHGDAESFNPNTIIEKLKKDGYFQKAFPLKEDQEDIIATLQKINKIPKIGAPLGITTGSGRLALNAMAGGTTYGMTGSAWMALAGAAAIPATQMAQSFVVAMGMKEGRHLLRTLLDATDGVMTPKVIQGIAAFARGAAAEPGSEMFQPPSEMPEYSSMFPMNKLGQRPQ